MVSSRCFPLSKHRHSKADINRLTNIGQTLLPFREWRQHQNCPNSKGNEEREQLPTRPANSFAPKVEYRPSECTSDYGVCSPNQEESGGGSHATLTSNAPDQRLRA